MSSRQRIKSICLCLLLGMLVSVTGFGCPAPAVVDPEEEVMRIAMVPKNLGNAFFEAARDGGLEAAAELGNVELIFTGPMLPTAEGQIEIIDTLIAKGVDAIAISSNDFDALVPITQRAMREGIEVISFDAAIAPAGRTLHLDPADFELIGRQQVQLIAEKIDYHGEIAVLSATAVAVNQNIWIEWMKEELQEPAYEDMTLVAVVFGDDLPDKSYTEAMGLFKAFPNLRGIISPTTVGVAATAMALEDAGLAGEIQLTGLGLPSEMEYHILAGTVTKMALWNPIDMGYTATYLAYRLVRGEIQGIEGEVVTVGRMGELKIGPDGSVTMGEPYVFHKGNIEKFADIY